MYHLNETPVGTVNGVNTTFTTANTLYQAVTITVDGVIYTSGVTFTTSTFTLEDAPTASVTISYYDEATTPVGSGTLLVSAVRTIFDRQMRDTTDVSSATFIDWCDWINLFLYREISKKDPERFIVHSTVDDTLLATGEYLPTDFKQIKGFNTGLFQEVNDVVQHEPELITKANSELSGYYISGNKIVFTPIERTEEETYDFRYTPREPKITAVTDTFIAPITNAYIEVVYHALNKFYEQWDEDAGMESLADFRFTRMFDELLSTIRRTPQVYFIDDPAQDF